MAGRAEIDDCLQGLFTPERFKDYGPNGLQVEGVAEITRIVSGVTANLALIDAAIECRAEAIFVHHGLFWRGQDGRITGWLKVRLQRLLSHGINLWAYHLPLDAHAELGNNAQLGLRLGLRAEARFGEQNLGFLGSWDVGDVPGLPSPAVDGPPDIPPDLRAWSGRIARVLGRAPIVVPGDDRPLQRLAWCSGGAQGYFESAIAAGADAFLTGEISEPQAHLARETGVAFLACGHHATERYGASATGAHLAERFGLAHEFIDIPNPA